jgi:Domain of unknown function DUF11/PASTA domain
MPSALEPAAAPPREPRSSWPGASRSLQLAIAGAAVVGALVVTAASASALTLGNTTMPLGGGPAGCEPGEILIQTATDSAYSYTVPPPGGAIASWSINTLDATAGTPVTLVVLRSTVAKMYTVVDVDPETLPTPLPASGIATFKVAAPIVVTGGETFGLTSTAGTVLCAFGGGSLTTADTIGIASLGGSKAIPIVGTSYEAAGNAENVLLNMSAELVQNQDVGVTGSATPSSITAGGLAEYAFTVSNGGVESGPITFSDAVPNGLTILSVAAGSGACTTAGQTVTCTITGLQPGSSSPVLIIVSAASAGSYADAASVSSAASDPNLANNSASATLLVSQPAPLTTTVQPPCKTVRLSGVTLSIAKVVIAALNCKVGKIKAAASKTVRKSLVISTSPGPGKTLSEGSAVGVIVSSGPPKPRRRR